jgi:hypothetical protein
MAKRVGFFENTDACYEEGPFVMVMANGWRVEVGEKGMKCPILPDMSIYGFRRDRGVPDGKLNDDHRMECVVNYLNAKVKDGTIVKKDGVYVWELHELNERVRLYQKKREI